MYVCMYMYVCVCIYIYIYIHTCIQGSTVRNRGAPVTSSN